MNDTLVRTPPKSAPISERIVGFLRNAHEGLHLAELTRLTGVSRQATHNALGRLCTARLVRRDDHVPGLYHLAINGVHGGVNSVNGHGVNGVNVYRTFTPVNSVYRRAYSAIYPNVYTPSTEKSRESSGTEADAVAVSVYHPVDANVDARASTRAGISSPLLAEKMVDTKTTISPSGEERSTARRVIADMRERETADPLHPDHPDNAKLPIMARWQNYVGAAANDNQRDHRLAKLAEHVLGLEANQRTMKTMRGLCDEVVKKDGLARGWEQMVYYTLSCANGAPAGNKEQYLRAVVRRMEGGDVKRQQENRPLAKATAVLAKADADARATMNDHSYDHIKPPAMTSANPFEEWVKKQQQGKGE